MIYQSDFPENGWLIEWSEEHQSFFSNEIKNHKPHQPTNKHNVIAVAVCDSWDEAYLIKEFAEDLLKTRGALAYGKKATTREIELFIKKLRTFSERYNRLLTKKQEV